MSKKNFKKIKIQYSQKIKNKNVIDINNRSFENNFYNTKLHMQNFLYKKRLKRYEHAYDAYAPVSDPYIYKVYLYDRKTRNKQRRSQR